MKVLTGEWVGWALERIGYTLPKGIYPRIDSLRTPKIDSIGHHTGWGQDHPAVVAFAALELIRQLKLDVRSNLKK